LHCKQTITENERLWINVVKEKWMHEMCIERFGLLRKALCVISVLLLLSDFGLEMMKGEMSMIFWMVETIA
jgi:hypothetical protein